MYVKKRNKNEYDILLDFIDNSSDVESLNDDLNAEEVDIPITTSTDDTKTSKLVPSFNTITDHGNGVVAGYVSIVVDGIKLSAGASASCHPDDEYDEWIGHSIVIARLCTSLADALQEVILHRANRHGNKLTKDDIDIHFND